MANTDTDFKEFAQTKITLFIFDKTMGRHLNMTLNHLGFARVKEEKVDLNYFQALARLVPLVAGDTDLVMINLPPKKRPQNVQNEMVPVYDQIHEMYLDLKLSLSKRSSDPLKFLSKTIPVIESGDYLREKLVETLFKFRVPAAFFLSPPEDIRHLTGNRKQEVIRENFQLHYRELTSYLNQYFRDKEQLVALADEKLSEKDLTQRKGKYDELMAEAQRLKEERLFEEAINVLRQAIEIFPKDIEAYLESGRLYTRRKEYGRALSRFAQAEDLFVDAPSPNKEIANVRLIQVQEKIDAGADPNGPEIKQLLNEAVGNYQEAHDKAMEMQRKQPDSPALAQPMAIGQEILKWNVSEMLGPKHPAVKALINVANQSLKELDKIPLDELTAMHCISLGLHAMDAGDIEKAKKYYFYALKDKDNFDKVCSEINFFGIRLRHKGHLDEAVKVYERLLKYKPHNQGSVFWNLSIVHALKNETLKAAGYTARCLYTDPFIAREQEFYDSLTPKHIPILLKLMKTLRLILQTAKAEKPPKDLVQLYKTHDRLVSLIAAGEKMEALRYFLKLYQKAGPFTLKPEFFGDGAITKFLEEIKTALSKNPSPKNIEILKVVTSWLRQVAENPAPQRLAHHLKLSHLAVMAMEQHGDQPLAAFYLGQSLLVVPESYFFRPDFYARQNLPAMAWELATKLKYIDFKKFPAQTNQKPKNTKRGLT